MIMNLNEVILSTPSAIPTSNVDPDLAGMVSGVGDLAEILSNYGPFVGILSVFLIIFLAVILFSIWSNKKMVKRILEKDANMEDLSQDLLNKIVTSVLGTLNSGNAVAQNSVPMQPVQYDEPIDKRNLVGKYIDVNIAFKDASRIAVSSLKCERVAIYVFHNGSTSLHGLPFFKMSCVHEWTVKSSRAIRNSMHSNLPLHAFSDMVEKLYRTGECAISNVRGTTIDDHTARFVEYTDIMSAFLLGIKDSDDNLAGFVIAEYRDTTDFADETKYNFVKQVLSTTIDNIRSIIIDESFQKTMNDD